MKNLNVKTITHMSMVAALYVVLTYAFAPLSYGAIQFRISEILVLLVLYRKEYSIPLVIGCLIANLMSPAGIPDVVFGTLATLIVVLTMPFIKNKLLSTSIPIVVNAVIIGLMLMYVYELPFLLTAFQIAFGEFVVITVIGLPIFKSLERNEAFKEILNISITSERLPNEGFLAKVTNRHSIYVFSLIIMLFVAFFRIPFEKAYDPANFDLELPSLYYYLINQNLYLVIVIAILPVINLVSMTLLKNKANLMVGIVLFISLVTFLTIIITKINDFNYWIILYYALFLCLLGINIYKLKEVE